MARPTDEEIATALAGSAWTRDGDAIVRVVEREFLDAVRIIDAVALAAERIDHHPDIELTGARRLRFRLWTWAAGGITRRDLALAREIDAIIDGQDQEEEAG